MLRAYYDCSGQPHDSEFVTLAGVIASESVWDRFCQEWTSVLERYQISEFHMADAMSLKRDFSQANGWSQEKVQKLVWDLWAIVGRFRATDGFRLGTNLVGSSCTVTMENYRRAKFENPQLRSPEAICTQYCVSVIPRDIDSDIAYPEISLVFDQNEDFRHPIYRNWQRYRGKREAGWPRQVKAIDEASSSNTPPLQAADLLAWTMNKHHRNPSFWKIVSVILLEHFSKTYDYEAIMTQFPNE